MSELTIGQLLRCSHVKRWHIVRTAREQTVAEHQWNVTMIALAIVDVAGIELGDDGKLALLLYALQHDAPEAINGDMPTPTKQALRTLHPGFSLDALDTAVSSRYAVANEWANTIQDGLPAAIVKIADLIESLWFLRVEAMGPHGAQVLDYIHGLFNTELDRAMRKWSWYRWWPQVRDLADEVSEP
jgi:5'-deoxynucleotidase